MLQLPTGGGKTVIGGALLAHWLADNRKAVWLTHRKELAEQTRGMLTDAGVSARANIRWPPGTDAPAMAGGVVILMAQTVGRRTDKRQVWNRYNPNDLMVIDEALSRVNYICRSCCLIEKCYRNFSTWGPPQPALIPASQRVPPWAHQPWRRPAFWP